jgi:hypothetical protein
MFYLTFVFPDADGYGFTAPDVEGFTAYADTADFSAAAAIARKELAAHLAALIDAGGDLPASRSLKELRSDPTLKEDFAEAETTLMLPAVLPAGRTLRVNLSFDENTLRLIDAAAGERSLTRSAFLAEAARRIIAQEAVGSMALGSSFHTLTEGLAGKTDSLPLQNLVYLSTGQNAGAWPDGMAEALGKRGILVYPFHAGGFCTKFSAGALHNPDHAYTSVEHPIRLPLHVAWGEPTGDE